MQSRDLIAAPTMSGNAVEEGGEMKTFGTFLYSVAITAGVVTLLGWFAFPIYFGDFLWGSLGVAFLALVLGFLICGTDASRVPADWKPVTWLILVAWLGVGHIYGCFATLNLKREFANIAVNSVSHEFAGEGAWAEEGSIRLDYGGALDQIVARRKDSLAVNGLVYHGVWWSGDRSPSSIGVYVWVGPFANPDRR